MKLDKFLTILWGFLLAFALSFSCMACIATAFSQELSVDLMKLALWCAFYSLVASVCFSFKLDLIILNVSLILAFVFCKYSDLVVSIQSMLEELSALFHMGYGWGRLSWDLKGVHEHTMALQAIGSVICLSVAWTVCRKRLSIWAIAGVLIPFLPCTFMLWTVPDERYLFVLLLALIMLLLTQSTRRRKETEGNKLTAILLIPTVLAMMALFAFAPQESYDGRDRAEAMLEKIEDYFDIDQKPLSGEVTLEDHVDLTKVGSQYLPTKPVMDVVAPFTENLYLRGRVYDIYDGVSWQDSGISSELPWQQYFGAEKAISISTQRSEPYLFHPYRMRPQMHVSVGNGLLNEKQLKEYTYSIYPDKEFILYDTRMYAYLADVERLTQLPVETLLWAKDLWEGQLFMGHYAVADDANLLVSIVKEFLSVKEYSLQTERMPEGYGDFAQWFTDESPTGYCVHFATAAAVLLRAQGIPARYVTGYCVRAEADKKTTVYEKNAHAWVEYWSSETGWMVLEATPSDEMFRPPFEETTPTTPTTERPSRTEEPTEPTEPTSAPKPTTPKPTTPDKTDEPVSVTETPFVLPQSVKWIALVLLIIVLIFVQSRVRVLITNRSIDKGEPNERALKLWRLLKRCRKSGIELPIELAQKAKFSNHTITENELAQMRSCLEESIQALRKRTWYYKLVDRIIFALY